jgi:hypothetical protein
LFAALAWSCGLRLSTCPSVAVAMLGDVGWVTWGG